MCTAQHCQKMALPCQILVLEYIWKNKICFLEQLVERCSIWNFVTSILKVFCVAIETRLARVLCTIRIRLVFICNITKCDRSQYVWQILMWQSKTQYLICMLLWFHVVRVLFSATYVRMLSSRNRLWPRCIWLKCLLSLVMIVCYFLTYILKLICTKAYLVVISSQYKESNSKQLL